MISISVFREYVAFVEEKIQTIVFKFEEFRPVAHEVRNKAIEIENYISHQEQEDDAQQPTESPTPVVEEQGSPASTASNSTAISRAESPPQQEPQRRTVKRRRTRVRRKIVNEVRKKCHLCFLPCLKTKRFILYTKYLRYLFFDLI